MAFSEVFENILPVCCLFVLCFPGIVWAWVEPVAFTVYVAAVYLLNDYFYTENLSLVEKELDEVRKELEAKDTEANSIKSSLDTLTCDNEKKLEEKEERIQGMDVEIEKKQQEIDTLKRDNEEKLKQKDERIRTMDMEIKKKQQEMEKLSVVEKELTAVKGQLAAKDTEATSIKGYMDTLKRDNEEKLKQKDERIRTMDMEIKKKQQEMEKLSVVEKELTAVKGQLAAKDTEATSIKGYMEILKCDFEEMLWEKEEHIQKMEEEIKQKQQEIGVLTARLETEQMNKEILEKQIAECKKTIEKLERKKNKLESNAEGYKDCLQEMEKKKYSSFMANLIRHVFENRAIPSTLVSVLQKYNPRVLTQRDIEKISATETNQGPCSAAAKLLCLLCRYEGWFPCLMKALRDPLVNQADVADKAESALEHVRDELMKQEYLDSANNSKGEHQMEFDFQSDINTEKGIISCENEASHDTFTTLNNFPLELLPENWQLEVMGDLIKAAGHLTVKVESKYISDRRPQGYPLHDLGGLCGLPRIGCGMVWTSKREFSTEETSNCPCRGCLQDEGKPKKRAEFIIFTDRHLIYDDDEGYFTTITVSYDNGDGNVKAEKLFPVSFHPREGVKGYAEITCVTHDEQVAGKLEKALKQYEENCDEIEGKISESRNQETSRARKCIIISYLHGLQKYVTVGDITDPSSPRYQALTCPGSSGSPVFVLGDCLEEGKYVSTSLHCTYNMASSIGQSCTWRR